jgi:RimJ/RimL family protein N-acetyltransferase
MPPIVLPIRFFCGATLALQAGPALWPNRRRFAVDLHFLCKTEGEKERKTSICWVALARKRRLAKFPQLCSPQKLPYDSLASLPNVPPFLGARTQAGAAPRLSLSMIPRIDPYWQQTFGLGAEQWGVSGVKVVPHANASMADHSLFGLVRGEFAVLSAPATLAPALQEQMRNHSPQELLDPEAMLSALDLPEAKYEGPLYQGFLTPEYFTPRPSNHVRKIPHRELGQLRELAARVGSADWEQSALERATSDFFAYVVNDNPVAVGHYSVVGQGNAATLGILTDPRHRRAGYAHVTLSAVIEEAFSHKLLVLYQSLKSNQASLALAQALGTIHYGWTLKVRLA